ncbi:uncharacterized protein TRAVEDRAFT_103431, partial [Trametes versicolor FP-101664 SS1]|uniref:uncharacterized protein n=1 Tax=Trametes versicolor (strain FP-101664) TaxID=717944 RepID=UPI00046247AD
PCNVDFLEHEKWLLCMLSEVDALPAYNIDILDARSSELRQLVCNELLRLQNHKDVEWRRQKVDVQRCERAEMIDWLARLLARPGMEDAMDDATVRAQGPPKLIMKDVWDAPVFRKLMRDGVPFVNAPPHEGRYIFGLSIDGFNPFHSKEAKQNVTVTGIYMVCLNLPPHLRYLPENVYLVGVIP